MSDNSFLKLSARLVGLSILLSAFFLSPDTTLADSLRQGNFYFSADIGSARMHLDRDGSTRTGTWLYGALRGEYAPYEKLLIGLEGAGWTDQLDLFSSIMEDVLTFMLTARVYPLRDYRTFARFNWGYARHRYWESPTLSDSSGTAYLVGLGYNFDIGSLSILFSNGNLGQETYNAFTVTLGSTF